MSSVSGWNKFLDVYEMLPGDGWLSQPEAKLLWDWLCKTEGDVLEVGCYKGRSTVLLAKQREMHPTTKTRATAFNYDTSGSREVDVPPYPLVSTIWVVDKFSDFDSADPEGSHIKEEFWHNLETRGIKNVILQIGDVSHLQPRQVGFAYLDGDHSYIGTLRQITKAVMCHPQVIAIHDVNDGGGGLEVKRAAIEMLGPWTDRIERLAVWDMRKVLPRVEVSP